LLVENTADDCADGEPLDLGLREEANVVKVRGWANTSAHWMTDAKYDQAVLVGLIDDLAYSHDAANLDLESRLLPKLPFPCFGDGLKRANPATGDDPLSTVGVLGTPAKQDAAFAHNDDGATKTRRSRRGHVGGLAQGEGPCLSRFPWFCRRYTDRTTSLRSALL